MRITRSVVWAVCFTLLPLAAFAQQKPEGREQDRRPRLTLRAQPPVGIAPARIVLTAELVGGVDDFEDYYCPTVDWEWGDDTQSESTLDCEPYEAGKSEIRRRFTVEHLFRRAGASQGPLPPEEARQARRHRQRHRADSARRRRTARLAVQPVTA